MKTWLKILCLSVFSSVLMKSGNIWVGTEGEEVYIRCQYPDKHKYTPKYFCRDPCTSSNVLIKTDRIDQVVSDGRYYAMNTVSANSFDVSIRKLNRKDAGVYYCGLDQWFRDTLIKVELSVRPAPANPPLTTLTPVFSSTKSNEHTQTVSTWTTTHEYAAHNSHTNERLLPTVQSTGSTDLIKSSVNVIVVCAVVLVLLVFWSLVALVFLYRRRSIRSLKTPTPENSAQDQPDLNQV
ncbi:CMRF35-like molecule 1 isoform X2 [Xyrauchen texanus]|uniref:CMRF35-like molecule 1 isoform X2 n=1 Tax=Xyrauchen texanus TaxID=154827 RepID=UPI002242522C|nr:CMRF35-like molecule 1 isoform X2 [Xyrauchen texanus]